MKVVGEYIANYHQYQKVSNGSWNMPMTGYRKRKLDNKGTAITEWEVISRIEYEDGYKKHGLYNKRH